ncbi:MAG: tetratricopeptide repeat protein [Desulfobacteraceae bacterium]|nr:tetratricopeptide repeat protein [Desulfobacteraceae bacterium]
MGNANAFDPKNLRTINPEGKEGLLDALNLPPQVVSFVRMNGKALGIGAVCLILALLGWSAYGEHTTRNSDEASALLTKAMEAPAGAQRTDLLRRVQAEYGGTGAALWSQVQLAHAAHDSGNEKEAIAGYRAVLDKVDGKNPLAPLLHYSLGQSYEAAGQPEEALRQYQQLAAIHGFAAKGLLAAARIHEARNQTAEAIKDYEQLSVLQDQPSLDKGYLASRLAALRAKAPAKQQPK